MLLQGSIRHLTLACFTSLCMASFIPESSIIIRGVEPTPLESINQYSRNVELHYENSIPKLKFKLFTNPRGSSTDSMTMKLAEEPQGNPWIHASNKKSDLLYMWTWDARTRKLEIEFFLWLYSKKKSQ